MIKQQTFPIRFLLRTSLLPKNTSQAGVAEDNALFPNVDDGIRSSSMRRAGRQSNFKCIAIQ